MNNNLFRHIEYLLLSHDCVIVPGLGAFIANSCPATIDHDKGIIVPSVRTIAFNQAVLSDDGLLANSYVRKYGLTFEEARQVIVRDTTNIKEKLTAKIKVSVGNIGILYLGEEENLIFAPSKRQNQMNEMMGFYDISFGTESEEALDEDSKEETSYYQFRISKAITRIVAVFAVLIVLSVFFLINPIPSDEREQRASVIPVEAIMYQALGSNSEKESVEQIITEAPVETNEINETSDIQADFYLIVATFRNEKEAEKYVAANSSDEFPMRIVKSKKMTRVSIAESNDKEELRKQLNSRKILTVYPNAWIWSLN